MSFAMPAAAQTTLPAPESNEAASNSDEIEVYTPDYFTQFVPQTAADMVARLPGFEIRGGGGDERGFGQASLNILINSRRPSSKSSGANQILGRIPASNVERIEIVDGASLNIPGLSGQVANIIAKTGELSGSWEYAIRWEEGSQPQLGDGEINVSGKEEILKLWQASISVSLFSPKMGMKLFLTAMIMLPKTAKKKRDSIRKGLVPMSISRSCGTMAILRI